MEDARVPTSEQLMAEMAWIRQLARALVKDAATADDVAQDTWLIAAEQKPAEDRPLRPWLARVVTNLVKTRRRSEARREQRQAASDDGRTVATPQQLVERVELQRAVADEVLALAEPYRSTVLLHFVEGLSSAEIARRLGIPDGTVRRRLKVALDRLRDALRARTDPPKHGWLAALVPFAGSPGRSPDAAAMGAFAMKKVIAVVVLLVLLLVLGIGLLVRHRGHGEDSSGTAAASGGGRHGAVQASDPPARTAIPAWIPQRGAPARRIAGRVVSHGAPIGGAKVLLGLEVAGEPNAFRISTELLGWVLQPIAEVTSAADGTFDFGEQPPARFTVSASAANHAAGSVGVANANPQAKTDQLVVELGDCQSRMFGAVVDASGGGIAKARISIAGSSGTDSDATGAYSLCMLPGRSFGTPTAQARIEADGYGTIRQDVIVVGELRHDFMLVPEAVLVGRVTTSDGQPVAGARVVAGADPGQLQVASGWADSDRDGRFRIAGLAPGAFRITAAAQSLGSASPIAAIAQPASTSREIHLVLAPLARVRGHVLLNGAPVGGVGLTALHEGGPPIGGGISQADGSFELAAVPYGAVKLVAPPYRVDAPKEIQIARAEVDDVRVELTKQGSVHGHVTRGGKPAAGADVMYMGAPQAMIFGPPLGARTDASGAFAIEGVPAGPGRMVAWDNANKAFAPWQAVELEPSEDGTIDFDLALTGEVKGTVVDEAGAPVAGVYVRMDLANGDDDMCESITDAGGRFDCAMLIGGAYRPTISPLPGGRQGLAPATGDQFALITVPSSGVVGGVTLAVKNERLAIRGSVVDDTGAPVADVHIEARGRGPSSMTSPWAMSDAQGRFEIANLARGTYNLHARAADGSETEVFDVAPGGDATTIKLARAGAIEGTLIGFTTTPIVMAQMLTRDLAVGGLAIVDGTTFSKIGLPPGRYTVEAKAGGEVDGQTVEIHPGETVKVTLRSHGQGSVEGTVSELSGHQPVAGLRCDANLSIDGQMSNSPPDVSQQAFTDAAGHFAVAAPVGRVRIFCFSPNGGVLSAAGTDVDVTTSARAKVNVFSVRATFVGGAPGDAGFMLAPATLPVTVNQVAAAGPAAAAGLRVGDRLVTIDGTPLDGVLPDGAMMLLMNHRAGTTATLGIERGGVAQVIKLVVGSQGGLQR